VLDTTCYARCLIPASMKADMYAAWIAFEMVSIGSRRVASKVLHALCTCVNGQSTVCSHVSALCWILHSLRRPPESAIPTPSTQEEMLWNQPSASIVYCVTRPLSSMAICHHDPDNLEKGFRAVRSDKGKRARSVHIEPHKEGEYHSEEHLKRLKKWYELLRF
jgi:hypothetical protein